jgi:hypothetical protein
MEKGCLGWAGGLSPGLEFIKKKNIEYKRTLL